MIKLGTNEFIKKKINKCFFLFINTIRKKKLFFN